MRTFHNEIRFCVQFLTALAIVFTATPSPAETREGRGFSYSGYHDEARRLDVYSPPEGEGHPVLLWIHGGGWSKGDKSQVHNKPQAFVDRGFVFVSANHRLVPQVTVDEAAADVAQAIRWVHTHAERHAGSPDTIFVAGHSSGAHLVALICTDGSYLKKEGLTLSSVKGCITVDCSAYDIPQRMEKAGPERVELYTSALGEDQQQPIRLSPITHVAPGKGIPPFLILYATDRRASFLQSRAFSERLTESGVENMLVSADGKTHQSINLDLGLPGDEPTIAVFEFLDALLSNTDEHLSSAESPGGSPPRARAANSGEQNEHSKK